MEEEIKQVETISVPETPVQLPKKSNLSKVVPLFILGLIILAGAVYAGVTIGRKQNPPEVIPQAVEASPTPDETADWETFLYTDSLFSFKYPPTWFYEDNSVAGGAKPGTTFAFFEQGVTPDSSYGDHIGNELFVVSYSEGKFTVDQEKGNLKNPLDIIVNNKPAIRSDTIVKIITNQGLIHLGIRYKQNQQYVDQILSTFKFTPGQNAVDETVNWKTYTNEKIKYSVNYSSYNSYSLLISIQIKIFNFLFTIRTFIII